MNGDIELKRCPFCNEPARLDFIEAECEHLSDVYGIYSNHLPNCPMIFVEIDYQKDKQKAIDEWNKRPIENELYKKIQELTHQITVMEINLHNLQRENIELRSHINRGF